MKNIIVCHKNDKQQPALLFICQTNVEFVASFFTHIPHFSHMTMLIHVLEIPLYHPHIFIALTNIASCLDPAEDFKMFFPLTRLFSAILPNNDPLKYNSHMPGVVFATLTLS